MAKNEPGRKEREAENAERRDELKDFAKASVAAYDRKAEAMAREEANILKLDGKDFLFMNGRDHGEIRPDSPSPLYPNLKFEITDHFPDGYSIYHNCRRLPDGYLPICRVDENHKIDKDSLQVIKVDSAERYVKLHMSTLDEMRNYISEHVDALPGSKEYDKVTLAREAIERLEVFDRVGLAVTGDYRYNACFYRTGADEYYMDLHIYDIDAERYGIEDSDYMFNGDWDDIRQAAYGNEFPVGLPTKEDIADYGDEILYVDDYEGWKQPRICTYSKENDDFVTEFSYPADLSSDYYAGLHNDFYYDMRHDAPEGPAEEKAANKNKVHEDR